MKIVVIQEGYPIIDTADEEFVCLVKQAKADISIVTSRELTDKLAKETDIIYGWPPKIFLKKCENLKWLHLPTSGTEFYCDSSLYKNPDKIILTNSTGVFGQQLAEHTIALLLALARQVHRSVRNMCAPVWYEWGPLREIYDSTVGIIGFGDIGKSVAERLKPFGCKQIIGIKRTPAECPDCLDRIAGLDALDEVIGLSDYLIICLPSTPETTGIITRERIFAMKKGAILINVGRGTLIDQDALIDALKAGHIGGAGLDVVTPEPLPYDNPLWSMQNVIITPHTAYISAYNLERKMQIFKENFRCYLNGEKMINKVDAVLGYRVG